MTIKQKTLGIVVSTLVITTIVLIFIALSSSKEALLESRLSQLESIEKSKAEHISDYFKNTGNLLLSIANHEGTKEAVLNLKEGFNTVDNESSVDVSTVKDKLIANFQNEYINKVNYDVPDSPQRRDINSYIPQKTNAQILQYQYIVDNKEPLGEKNNLRRHNEASSYNLYHYTYHPTFNNILNLYGLYDIFLIDTNGDLFYSVFKEKDYATNLLTGPYKDSGIAEVFRKAMKLNKGEIAFDDFRPYEPSYNLPASFIATPIYEDGEKTAVLIYQMAIDRINEIMSFNGKYKDAGLGESGETYLIGPDFKMRNNSRFTKDIQKPIIQKLQTTIGIFEVKTDSIKRALKGQEGAHIIDDYRGVSVLSAYSAIPVFNKQWAIVAEIDEEEALEDVVSLRNKILIASIVIAIIMLVIVGFMLDKMMIRRIINLKETILQVAENRDLTVEIEVKYKDEIGEIRQSFKELLASLQHTIDNAKKTSEENSSISHELSSSSDNISKLTQDSVTIVGTTTENGRSVRDAILKSKVDVEETKQEIESANENLQEVKGRVLDLAEQIQVTSQVEAEMADKLAQLSNDAEQVKGVLDVISDIAEQTNLLALNAAIEAARAGEHGRGFAVVADEVRKLAERTQKSLAEINSTINIIVQAINDSSEQINSNSQIFDRLISLSDDSQDKIKHTAELMSSATIRSVKSVESADENSKETEELVKRIEEINEISSKNLRSTEEISSAANHLYKMTDDLTTKINEFRT